jgi:hypothetical protein
MKTVDDPLRITAEQSIVSPTRAAGWPLMRTLADPVATRRGGPLSLSQMPVASTAIVASRCSIDTVGDPTVKKLVIGPSIVWPIA